LEDYVCISPAQKDNRSKGHSLRGA
jgi:hypothetical protein